MKDEGRLPTGSFKARGLAMAVTMAKQFGIKSVALPTNGNAGAALAAYAARGGDGDGRHLSRRNARDQRARNRRLRRERLCRRRPDRRMRALVGEGAAEGRWFDCSTLKEPYRLEGKKVMGFELVEQLGWKVPDAIFYPTGGGTGLIGMWKAFDELEAVGLIGPERPRMYAIQAAGCAPMVRAFERGDEFAERWEDAATVATGIRVPKAVGDFLILRAVRESGGAAIAVEEQDIVAAVEDVARDDGFLLCPEGGAVLAGWRRRSIAGSSRATRRCCCSIARTGTNIRWRMRRGGWHWRPRTPRCSRRGNPANRGWPRGGSPRRGKPRQPKLAGSHVPSLEHDNRTIPRDSGSSRMTRKSTRTKSAVDKAKKQSLRIASYNINGINSRLAVLLRWLDEFEPDIVGLQELKCTDEAFPAKAIEALGYHAIWHGQKSWNGVAILSRVGEPVETGRGLPGDPDDQQSRYIEAAVCGILIGNLYLPNGNPWPGPKFDYKLAWMDRLSRHAQHLLDSGLPAMLIGDFNVIPTDQDVYKPERWAKDALFSPRGAGRNSRSSLRRAGPTRSARCIRTSGSTRSGTIGGTRSSATQASASTICCSARRSQNS